MIKFEKTEVWGWEHAIRGMRNPMNSWDKSDSEYIGGNPIGHYEYIVGENDKDLAKRLTKAGQPHRKFLRQVFVSVDISASIFWWKEFDTYKVGTTKNSCSTMHKIHVKEFTADDFSHEGIDEVGGIAKYAFMLMLDCLNNLRTAFNETHDKKYWRALIELLPEGYIMKATVTMTYENVLNMWEYRRGHKLFEWADDFVEWAEGLPHFKELCEVL